MNRQKIAVYWEKLCEGISSLHKRGFFHIIAGSTLAKIAGFVSVFFLPRFLSKADYGLLTYVDNIRNYVMLFNGIGITQATLRYCAQKGSDEEKKGYFLASLKVGILAAIGSFAGSALGAHIVLMLSDEVLQMMMFIILPIAAVVILWRRNLPDENRDDGTLNLKKALLALGIGLGIGLYDGMVGPGTGTFAIIAFTSLMGFDLRTANGNAKVLNLASNYASLFTYLSSGLVVFPVGIPCAISNIVGNIIGSHFALRKGAKFIRPMMLVVLVLLLGKLITDML